MFEWDPPKAAANLRKHEISFDEATTVFEDGAAVDATDLQHSGVESRVRRIGRSRAGAILMVVYTVRSSGYGETIRIISARRANRTERAAYLALAQED